MLDDLEFEEFMLILELSILLVVAVDALPSHDFNDLPPV